MTQDFAKTRRTGRRTKTTRKSSGVARGRPNIRKKTGTPPWAYGLIGLLLAVLITLLLATLNHQHRGRSAINNASTDAGETPPTPQPRFDFYEILKQQEVEVPDRSGEVAAGIPRDQLYLLQAGSFRDSGDADELRAQLLLLNLEARVEPGVSNGDTWHRVIVGPFQSRSKMAKARGILAANNLSPLLLKRKASDYH